MAKRYLILGTLLGAISVIFGAFGAHTLKTLIEPNQLEIFHTGIRYQFYHTFAILILGIMCIKYPNRFFNYAGVSFLTGILLFSGSLYLLASRFILGIESWTWIGPVTPIGGVFLIAGWILFFVGLSKCNFDE